MQDTLINVGRGIDGMVGRMVDRFGDTPSASTSGTTPAVALVRFIVVNVAEGHERVLHVDETLVTDGISGRDLERRLLAPYAAHVDRKTLRVHTRLLNSWPRQPPKQPAPATAEAVPETKAAPDDPDQRLISALAGADEAGLSMAQLVKQLGERSAALRVRLQRLNRDGTVRRAGDGLKTRYRLTNPVSTESNKEFPS